MSFYCPKCKQKTMEIVRVRDIFGNEDELITCRKCGFTVTKHVLEIECIPSTIMNKLPSWLRAKLQRLIRERKLLLIERFSIITGRSYLCIEENWKIRDEEARQTYLEIYDFAKRTNMIVR